MQRKATERRFSYLQFGEPYAGVMDPEDEVAEQDQINPEESGDPGAVDLDEAEVAAADQRPFLTPPPAGALDPDDQSAPQVAAPTTKPTLQFVQNPVTRYRDSGVEDENGHTLRDPVSTSLKLPAYVPGTAAIPVPTDAPPMIPEDLPGAGAFEAISRDTTPGEFENRVPGRDRDLSGALKTEAQIEAKQPIRPVPNWLQRLAATGIGAAAGYSNAARRAAPIDIAKTTEGILYPGYEAKLAAWQSKVSAAKQQVENQGQQVSAEYAGQKIQSETQLKQAQSYQAMQHGEYWLQRSQQERNQWKIDPKSGALYNTISGQRVDAPPTALDRLTTAQALGATPEQAREYALNGKMTVQPQRNTSDMQAYLDANHGDPEAALAAKLKDETAKAQQSRDPMADVYRQQAEDDRRAKESTQIDQSTQQAQQRVRQALTSQITQINNATNITDKGGEIARVKANAQRQLQDIQNGYAQTIRRRGGTADDYDVNPDLTYTARNPYGPFVPAGAGVPAGANPYRR